jgi:hypothetical protein
MLFSVRPRRPDSRWPDTEWLTFTFNAALPSRVRKLVLPLRRTPTASVTGSPPDGVTVMVAST